MRWLVLMMVGAATVLADTNLFQDGKWLIDGATDPEPDARLIQIIIDQEPAGQFSELKFYYQTGSNTFEQIWSLKGSGVFRPSLPAPGIVGGAFRIGGYWDCAAGYVGHFAVTDLQWKSKSSGKGELRLQGRLTNDHSMVGEKLDLRFLPVEVDWVQLAMSYQLRATRDFCVVRNDETQDEFHAIEMLSNFVSTNQHRNDLCRYVKSESTDYGYYGSSSKREPFCIRLSDLTDGYIVRNPRRLGDPRMQLAHTAAAPTNTPTLAVAYTAPNRGRIKPQGVLAATDDPTVENVMFFGNWVDTKREYKTGQKVGKFRVVLEITPPKQPNCETYQEPPTSAP
jgi:hypothetical protein